MLSPQEFAESIGGDKDRAHNLAKNQNKMEHCLTRTTANIVCSNRHVRNISAESMIAQHHGDAVKSRIFGLTHSGGCGGSMFLNGGMASRSR